LEVQLWPMCDRLAPADGSNLQSISINAWVHFTQLAATLCTVLLGFPLSFALELDARGGSEHVLADEGWAVVHLSIQIFLPAAHRAVVGGTQVSPAIRYSDCSKPRARRTVSQTSI